MILRNISFIAVMLVLASVVGGQTTSDKSALAALKKYDDAWNKKDAKTVGQVLHKNYIYFSSEGGTTPRARTLEFLGSPDYVLTFVERSEITTFDAGNTVIVGSRWKGKGTYEKGVINDDQRCSLVFVRVGSIWQLLSEHCTQIVVK